MNAQKGEFEKADARIIGYISKQMPVESSTTTLNMLNTIEQHSRILDTIE